MSSSENQIPPARTATFMAQELGVSVARVRRILSACPFIKATARAGRVRLYDSTAKAQVLYQINLEDARAAADEEVAQ